MIRTAPLAALALMACSPGNTEQNTLAAVEAQRREAAAQGTIACAKRDETALAERCTIDRTDTPEGLVLTVRHPDGAFRRLLVTTGGRGVIAADGAEPARVTVLNADQIEVTVAGERYRLPATVKPR